MLASYWKDRQRLVICFCVCWSFFVCLLEMKSRQWNFLYFTKQNFFLLGGLFWPKKELDYTLRSICTHMTQDLFLNVLCYWLSAKIVISNVIVLLLKFNGVIYTVKVSHRPLRCLRRLNYFHFFNVPLEQQYTLEWKRHFASMPH